MILKLLNWAARKLDGRMIYGEDKTPYLYRGYLWGWRPGVTKPVRSCGYLHRFFRGDLDDAPHSHPWPWSFSIVLWGGYTEERMVRVYGINYMQTRRVWPLTINRFREGDYHRITKLHGAETWTLFITGPKSLSWGFWVFGRGHVPWRERLAERGIHVEQEV